MLSVALLVRRWHSNRPPVVRERCLTRHLSTASTLRVWHAVRKAHFIFARSVLDTAHQLSQSQPVLTDTSPLVSTSAPLEWMNVILEELCFQAVQCPYVCASWTQYCTKITKNLTKQRKTDSIRNEERGCKVCMCTVIEARLSVCSTQRYCHCQLVSDSSCICLLLLSAEHQRNL